MDWNSSELAGSEWPESQPRRTPFVLIAAVALLFLCLGAGLGWLLFKCDQEQETCEPVSAPTATIAAAVVLPPAQPLSPGSDAIPADPTSQPSPIPTSPRQSPTPSASSDLAAPDLTRYQAQALDLINQSRVAAGLSMVAWDDAAARVAQAHAEDMLAGEFFSHWNRAGFGPDHRAALDAGMTDAVFENIHTFWRRTSDDQPAPIEDWPQRVLDAHLSLMDSPGHRRNIMDPAHTRVGIGIAYRPDIGEMRLVQEFVNRYVELNPLPAELPVGAEVEISGRLLNGASDALINLAYEPFPQPLSLEQLAETGSYQRAAQFFSAPRTTVDGDRFSTRAILDYSGQPGLYHVWVFVTVQGGQVMAASPIIVVR